MWAKVGVPGHISSNFSSTCKCELIEMLAYPSLLGQSCQEFCT